MTLGEATRAVFAKRPDLADRAVVERYPLKYNATSGRYDLQGGIFAYQFMSAAGLNIATYIPDMSDVSESGGLQFQEGIDGLGRPYDSRLIHETMDISDFKVKPASQSVSRPGM